MVDIKRDIFQIDFTKDAEVINRVDLLQVSTIKAKFIEQMEAATLECLHTNDFKVIGKTNEFFIIALTSNNQLMKTLPGMFRDYLYSKQNIKNPDIPMDILWEEVYEYCSSIRQLFTT